MRQACDTVGNSKSTFAESDNKTITAAQLALRLLTHASVISKLSKLNQIPFTTNTDGQRRYNFDAVVECVKKINTALPKTKKILTKYFRQR